MSKAVKGPTPTLLHSTTVVNVQRPRTVQNMPVRSDPMRQNRPNSRGTPSRASNNSRGARASDE